MRAAISKSAAVLTGATLLHVASPVGAEELETARLEYRAPAAICPDEESFRHRVAGRLGYDAFREDGNHGVSVAIAAERGRVRGRAEVVRRGQSAPGIRELDGDASQCDAIVEALATAVAIAIDPVRGVLPPTAAGPSAAETTRTTPPAPAPPAEAPPESSVVDEAPEPAPAGPKDEPPARPTLFGAADGVLSLGLAPAPAVGGEIGLGLRWRSLSVEAAARIEATTSAERVDTGDRLEATIYSGVLAPCAAIGAWLGCITGRVGAFQARAPDVVNANLGTSAFAAVGARAGYVLAVGRVVSLRAIGFVELPLVRNSLLIDGAPVWTAPPVMGGIALGATFSIL